MVIDFHTHILDRNWLPERWWSWLADYYNSRRDNSLLPQRNETDVIERICDPDGTKLLSAMEHARIDRSVVLPLDWGILLGEPSVPIEEQHLRLAEIARNSNGRLIPFAGIDPRRKNAADFIRRCLHDYNMQGIKLYPATGYDLHDDAFRPLFEAAMDYGVPVLLHTGCSFGPFLSKYAQPGVLDYLCATYPKITFIAAHLGAGNLEQLCWLGYAKPNLYADCSLMQITSRLNHRNFAENVRLACDLFGSRRILFGSDWPFSQTVMSNTDFVAAFRKLTSLDGSHVRFAGYEVKQILGASAEELIARDKRRTE